MTQITLIDHNLVFRKIVFAGWILLGAIISLGQSISPLVQPTGGGYSSNNNLQLQYTIGEPLITTYNIAHYDELSQGFEQPELNIYIDDCMSSGPCHALPFNNQSEYDTIYITSKLLFFSPGYDYNASDSIYFNYHVLSPTSGSEIVGITPVKFTCNGYYLADNLSALSSGNNYLLEFILFNGNRYTFNLKKN